MFFKNEEINWFFGFVEDSSNPTKVKVRVLGANNLDTGFVDTENLFDAMIATPADSSGFNGLGASPSHLWEGACVFGISLDKAYTKLVVLNTITSPDDVCSIALGSEDVLTKFVKDRIIKADGVGTTFTEPTVDYTKIKYPYNKATVTRSGHIIEVDDTPGFERLYSAHRTGSYALMDYTGDYTLKSSRDFSIFATNDFNNYVGGNKRTRVKGSFSERVDLTRYQSSKNWFHKAVSALFTIPLLELHGILKVSEKLTSPRMEVGELHVKKIVCDDIEVANEMKGTAAFAKQAAKASSIGPVTPVTGSSPSVDTSVSLVDDGGESTSQTGPHSESMQAQAPKRDWSKISDKYGPLKELISRAFSNRGAKE